MINSVKIFDIDATHTEVEILLNQCDGENVINIFEKSMLSKSILSWPSQLDDQLKNAMIMLSCEKYIAES